MSEQDVQDWEARVARFWETQDLDDVPAAVATMEALAAERGPDHPDAQFELGGVHDSTGDEARAEQHYARARELGLSGARLARLDIQEGSTLRNLGRLDEAVAMLEATPAQRTLPSATPAPSSSPWRSATPAATTRPSGC